MRLSHWGDANFRSEAVFTRAGTSEYGSLAGRSANQGSSITCRRLGAYTNKIAGLTLDSWCVSLGLGPRQGFSSRDLNLKFADRFPRAADRWRSAQWPLFACNPVARSSGHCRPGTQRPIRLSGSRSIPLVLAVAELDLDARHAGRLIQRPEDLAEARAELSGALELG